MAKLYNGGYTYPNGISVAAGKPLDDRLVLNSVEDLYINSSTRNAGTAVLNKIAYTGMLVIIANNGNPYVVLLKNSEPYENGSTTEVNASNYTTYWTIVGKSVEDYISGTIDPSINKLETEIAQHGNKLNNYADTFPQNPVASSESNGLMSAADKAKVGNYPEQFVLDLGILNSQEDGERAAARSEVAGNRNISFIRFQVHGVNELKTTLIMQWPNGINQTAQIMCVDKQQWRRNVTGATGVVGAPTNAYNWERTAPHSIDYDEQRRIIQLKDYENREVSQGVELPLATSTQDGLMSSADKSALTTANTAISDLGLALRGQSANSSAYTDPFILLDDSPDWEDFTAKLDDIANLDTIPFQKYMGRCRAKVSGITVELYNFINNFRNKDFSQVVLGNVSAKQNEQGKWQVTFTPNKFNIIHRQHKEGKWTDWQRINEHPLATSSLDGLMSADDKKALDSVDSAFKNLEGMNFNEASEYCATFDNIIEKLGGGAIRFSKPTIFTFSGAGNDQGMIINLPSSTRIFTQYAFTKATINGGFSRRFVQYDLSSLTITNVGEWLPISSLIPAATTSAAGLMSADDKKKLNKTKPVEEVTWTEQHAMNGYTECGEYHIHGERKNKYDGLPILNADPGHTIDATLTVLDSSLSTEGAKNDVCVTQILRLSNRTGGDGHIYVRTGQAATKAELTATNSTKWGTWEKLMGLFEKSVVTNIDDLNTYTTNGMYSGMFTNTNAESKSLGGLQFNPGDTFLIVTVNGYAASAFGTPQLTQMLYLLPTKKDNANAKMYMRTAYWDKDTNPKAWAWANWDRIVTASELSALEARVAALESRVRDLEAK